MVPNTKEENIENQKRVNSEILPFVYKKGNEFEILYDLDLGRNDEFWGFRLQSGIFLKATCGPGDDVESITWDNCKAFSESMFLNGKQGQLPSAYLFEKFWGEEQKAVKATVKFLKENGIKSKGLLGFIWCLEEDGSLAAYFSFGRGAGGYFDRNISACYNRLSVFFYPS